MAITKVIIGGDGEPPAPDWTLLYEHEDDLEIAREEWGRVVRDMREAQILSVANGHAIRRLVDFRVQYARASEHVAEHGAIFRPKRGKLPSTWNPWFAVMRQCDDAIRHLEVELGISPLRRNKAGKVNKRETKARAADAYLKVAKP